jgi:hypothetical protein
VLTMRPPVHPRGRGWSPDWGNPGWERRNGPPRPHHGRSDAGRRVRRDAGGCGRDDPRDGTRENTAYLTSRSAVRSGPWGLFPGTRAPLPVTAGGTSP